VVGRFLKLLYALAQALSQFRQLFGAKKNQHDSENQNDFSAAQIEYG
jgi:hypothetical protein